MDSLRAQEREHRQYAPMIVGRLPQPQLHKNAVHVVSTVFWLRKSR